MIFQPNKNKAKMEQTKQASAPQQQTVQAQQPEGTTVPSKSDAANLPEKKKATIPEQLKPIATCFVAAEKAFIEAGSTRETFTREINFASQILLDNPYLLEVAKENPQSLIDAIKRVSLTQLSLNPELKLGYLVPRKSRSGSRAVYFTSSYMGKREILMRSGCVKWIEANLVYEGDKFEMLKGTTTYLNHLPDPWADHGKENIKGGYWVAKLHNGEQVFDTVNINRIKDVMSRSEAVKAKKGSPWDTDFEQMARKTILNAAFSQLPKTGISESVLKALEAEASFDNDEFEDWKKGQEARDTFSENEGKVNFTDYEEVKG